MTVSEFGDLQSAARYIEAALSGQAETPDVTAVVSQACAGAFTVTEYPELPPGSMGMMVLRTKWVVRDEDLKMAQGFFSVAGAGVAIAMATTLPAGAIVSLVGAVFMLYYAAHRKGAGLDEEQCTLLMAMRAHHEPATIETLASLTEWAPERVASVLAGLTKLRCHDGSVMSVVAQDGKGLWATAGI